MLLAAAPSHRIASHRIATAQIQGVDKRQASSDQTVVHTTMSDSAVLNDSPSSSSSRQTVLYPPMNFAYVEKDFYRSAYPNRTNTSFLLTLNLKTIVIPEKDEFSSIIEDFARDNNMTLIVLQEKDALRPPRGSIHASSPLAEDMIIKASNTVLDSSHYPLLVSCKDGRNFVGAIVGCVRKLQKWSLMSIFEEFRRFSGTRQQQHEQFIELFDTDLLTINKEKLPEPFLGSVFMFNAHCSPSSPQKQISALAPTKHLSPGGSTAYV